MEVKTDDLIKNEKIEQVVEKKQFQQQNNPPLKRKFKLKMNPQRQVAPNQMLKRAQEALMAHSQGQKTIGNVDSEVQGGVKQMIFKGASMPMRNTEKREKFQSDLQNSAFLNKYVDTYGHMSYLDAMNDHYKAVAIYGYHYMQNYSGGSKKILSDTKI
jgi:hypothetical protein